MRLFHVSCHHAAETIQTMFLDRHPYLERAEWARLLTPKLTEPRRSLYAALVAVGPEIGRHKTEGVAHGLEHPVGDLGVERGRRVVVQIQAHLMRLS